MANPFVHVELQTQDPDKAKAFYRNLFDWKLEELPMGGSVYTTKKAETLGATIVTDVTEIPNYGWFSVIADPTGAALGLWQRKGSK